MAAPPPPLRPPGADIYNCISFTVQNLHKPSLLSMSPLFLLLLGPPPPPGPPRAGISIFFSHLEPSSNTIFLKQPLLLLQLEDLRLLRHLLLTVLLHPLRLDQHQHHDLLVRNTIYSPLSLALMAKPNYDFGQQSFYKLPYPRIHSKLNCLSR